MNPWTIVALNDNTGQVIAEWVEGTDTPEAFAAYVAKHGPVDGVTEIVLIAAVPGWIQAATPREDGDSCYVGDYSRQDR